MAAKQRPPAVVAELGRPETPGETAARKTRDSRLYRERKTVNNLVYSLLVTLVAVLVIVLIVPRGTDSWSGHSVDVAEIAAGASPSTGVSLVAPEVPAGWVAKQAELRSAPSGDITYWYIGYTTASGAYAAVVQAFTTDGRPVDATWQAQQLEGQTATGTDRIGGLDWTVYDHQDRSPDEANMLYGLQAEADGAAILVYGTDNAESLRELAAAVAASAGSSAVNDTVEAE